MYKIWALKEIWSLISTRIVWYHAHEAWVWMGHYWMGLL